MSHRPTGERFKELALGQLIKKLVQMTLDRLDGLLQEKKHQHWESQLALAGEILRPHSMASQEVLIAQFSAQSFNQGDEVMRNVMNSRLHPQGNGGTAEHVQAKSFIDNMLQLIQWQWGNGYGLGPDLAGPLIAGATGSGSAVLDVTMANPAQASQASAELGIFVFNLSEVGFHE